MMQPQPLVCFGNVEFFVVVVMRDWTDMQWARRAEVLQ